MKEFYEDTLKLDTSQNVRVDLPLAGIGTRMLAFIIDSFIIILTLVFILAILAILNIPIAYFDKLPGYALAMIYVFIFLLTWGYFPLFEYFNGGQTPGKKALKIKVKMDNGAPLNFAAALIRNLLRVVDYLPAIYALALIFILLNERNKRIGDIAAGTVVILEKKIDLSKFLVDKVPVTAIDKEDTEYQYIIKKVKITDREYEMLADYFNRKKSIDLNFRITIINNICHNIKSETEQDKVKSMINSMNFQKKEELLKQIKANFEK